MYDTSDNPSNDLRSQKFSNSHAIPTSCEKSIQKEMESLDFPEDITKDAIHFFNEMSTGTTRNQSRKLKIFVCFYMAFNKMGKPFFIREISKKCGIKPNQINGALTKFSQLQTGVKQRIINWNPTDFIRLMMTRIQDNLDIYFENIEELISDMTEKCNQVLEKDETLLQDKPGDVASAFISYYLSLWGHVLDRPKMVEILYTSGESTINKHRKKIDKVYNF